MAALHRVFLVGPMGAGKTTIGKYLAQHLKLRFADTDSEIEIRRVFDADDFGPALTPELRAQEERLRAESAARTQT